MPYSSKLEPPTPRGDADNEADVLSYFIAKYFYALIKPGQPDEAATLEEVAKKFEISPSLVQKIAAQKDRAGPKVWLAFETKVAGGSKDKLRKLARETWNKDVKEKGIVFTPKSEARAIALAAARVFGVSKEVLERIPEPTLKYKNLTKEAWWELIRAEELRQKYTDPDQPEESPEAVEELLTRRLLVPAPTAHPSATKIKICK